MAVSITPEAPPSMASLATERERIDREIARGGTAPELAWRRRWIDEQFAKQLVTSYGHAPAATKTARSPRTGEIVKFQAKAAPATKKGPQMKPKKKAATRGNTAEDRIKRLEALERRQEKRDLLASAGITPGLRATLMHAPLADVRAIVAEMARRPRSGIQAEVPEHQVGDDVAPRADGRRLPPEQAAQMRRLMGLEGSSEHVANTETRQYFNLTADQARAIEAAEARRRAAPPPPPPPAPRRLPRAEREAMRLAMQPPAGDGLCCVSSETIQVLGISEAEARQAQAACDAQARATYQAVIERRMNEPDPDEWV